MLIPFGLNERTGELVDIEDVARGKQCGCVCPSCKTPLEARHGAKNEWHFAHLSRNVSEATKIECDYSYWTSIHLMAKQILKSLTTIRLPECRRYHNGKRYLLRSEAELQFETIEIEKIMHGFNFDAIIRIENFNLAIQLDHPKRVYLPIRDDFKSYSNLGVIEVSLELMMLERENAKTRLSYLLNECTSSKSWVWHPKELQYIEKYGVELSPFSPEMGIYG